MRVSIDDPVLQTNILIVLLVITLLLGMRRKTEGGGFTLSVTDEIKGFAILTVIFGHIGYFLVNNNQFIFPLGTISGVGVNLFLILSGFGLTMSALKRPLNILEFYQKRLKKLYIPYWLILFILLLLDALVLHKTYPTATIIQMLLGWINKANLYQSLDSPLWYFSFIIFYYLIFPIFTYRKLIYFSPLLIYLFSLFLVYQNLPIDPGVQALYQTHIIAFPLGIVIALIIYHLPKKQFTPNIWLRYWRWIVIPMLISVICYFAIYSGVGQGVNTEQRISIFTSLAIICLALAKKVEFKLFSIFGLYSYEIYLFHWPLLYRYDVIYKILPAGVATFLYLIIFILLAMLFKKAANFLAKKLKLE